MRRYWYCALVMLAACRHGGAKDAALAPSPEVAPQDFDRLWTDATHAFRHGKWNDAIKQFQSIAVILPPGDPRIAQSHFYLGEANFAKSENLESVREFRRVSDESPNDALASKALLRAGDAYADLWRRPELDPSYGQTALSTYQELVSRYPGTPEADRAQKKIKSLEEKFAIKQYKAALYYLRYKAYDSAILYLKDLVATYPRSSVAPDALMRLVSAYQRLGYQEDVRETCGYIRRFHPNASGVDKVCPVAGAS